MCELMFPKPVKKKKRKHHPAPIVDTVKGECFLCRLEGIHRQQYTEEHHVFYGGALRQISEENGFKVYLCIRHHKFGTDAVHDGSAENKRLLQKIFEAKYEETHTREEFKELIGRYYIESDKERRYYQELLEQI